MSNLLDSEIFNEFAVLVTFLFGATPHVYRYCRWTEDLTIEGQLFVSVPKMSIETGKQDGSTVDVPYAVTMPTDLPPMDTLTAQRSHAMVYVIIEEVNPSYVEATRRVLWKGTISSTTQNPNGAVDLTKAMISGWKLRMQMPLGIIADSSCSWTFGDYVCKKDRASLVQTAVITNITGSYITIPGLTNPRANYFQNGVANYDGLDISIRDVSTYGVDSKLLLYKPPPPSWQEQTVAVYPGCDRKIATCREWSNEARFGGFGIAQQAYHPMAESPK